MLEVYFERLRSCDEATGRGYPLREGTCLYIDLGGIDALCLADTPSRLSDRADRMCLIDEEEGAIALLDLDPIGEWCLITIHTEDLVDGEDRKTVVQGKGEQDGE